MRPIGSAAVLDSPDGQFALVAMATGLWVGCAAGFHHQWLLMSGLRVALLLGLALVGLGPASCVLSGRRTAVVLVGSILLGLGLGVRADRVYEELPPDSIATTAQLVADPVRRGRVTEAVLRLEDGSRVEAVAFGPLAHRMSRLEFGEGVQLSGRLRPLGDQQWLKSKHIEATLSLTNIEPLVGVPWYFAVSGEVRSLVDDGSRHLPAGLRPLYDGLVTGDDRDQGVGQRSVFRAAGLGHLVAVSGQNVAFVLAVAAPLIRSLARRLRLPVVLLILGLFLIVTRMEPSVLRAVTCAGISTWAALDGRERSGVSVLAAACAGLLIIDPFLAVVVAFQLSVVASLGILAITPILIERLPGPSAVVQPLSVTMGAQLAVSPLLIAYFDTIPLVSLPANLLVGWAAGAVMMLGLTAGLAAGVLTRAADSLSATVAAGSSPPLAAASHVAGLACGVLADLLLLPVELLLQWIDWAARQSVFLPLPTLGLQAFLSSALLVLVWNVRPRSGPMSPLVGAAALVSAGLLIWSATQRSPRSSTDLGVGCLWLPDVSTLILERSCGPDLVDAVLVARIRSVELVVIEGGAANEASVAAIRDVAAVQTVLAPPLHNLIDARRVSAPVDLHIRRCAGGDSHQDAADACVQHIVELRPSQSRKSLAVTHSSDGDT